MKNRIIAILLSAIVIIFGLSGCGGRATDAQPPINTSGSGSSAAAQKEPAVIDENILTVDITIPAEFYQLDDSPDSEGLRSGDDLKDYIAENGFTNAKWNDDGSLTITMTKGKFNEFKAEMETSTAESLNSLSADYSFIVSVDHTDAFKDVTISVDRVGYEEDMFGSSFISMIAGFSVSMYRAFTGEDENFSLIIADATTGEQIEKVDFPIEPEAN